MKHARVALVAVIVVVASCVVSRPSAEAVAILATPPGSVAAGDTFSVPVSIVDGVDVWSWQFDLAFDPLIVQATGTTEGPFLSSAGTTFFGPGAIDNTTGLVSLVTGAYMDLLPYPSGDGVLATIEFIAIAPGAPMFGVSNAFVNLLPVGPPDDPPTTVPEPATLLALASGLLLMHVKHRLRG